MALLGFGEYMKHKLVLIADVVVAYELTCRDKYIQDGYVDLSTISYPEVNKEKAIKILHDNKSKYLPLFEFIGDREQNEYKSVENWIRVIGDISKRNEDMKLFEARLIISWIYKIYNTRYGLTDETRDIAIEIFNTCFEHTDENNAMPFYDTSIVYNNCKVFPKLIKSASELLSEIVKKNNRNASSFFYRGHGSINYQLVPSVFRKDFKTGELLFADREQQLYNEILYRNPSDFDKCSTHLDRLTIMQHYGLPTRLLDITSNPLVALYFACGEPEVRYGEVIALETDKRNIKWANSDTVSILASIPALSSVDKKEIAVKASECLKNGAYYDDNGLPQGDVLSFAMNKSTMRLVEEVRTEKPGFEERIEPVDIFSRQFVYAPLNNQRIIKQSGAFILFGEPESGKRSGKANTIMPFNECRAHYDENRKILFIVTNKNKILEELQMVSVDEISLFPEIEDVTRAIVKRGDKLKERERHIFL